MTAQTEGRYIIDVMATHAYLPTCIISDKGSHFRAEKMQEIAKVLDIKQRHATTNFVHTIGILEKTHSLLKTLLKISTGERKSMWHNYVQKSVVNYKTTYHESLGCELSTVFYGRIPYNVLDLKLGLKPQWNRQQNTALADQLLKQIEEIKVATKKENLMVCYIKYKRYYDWKADATPLNVYDYCYIVNPKADNQSTKVAFIECIWTGSFIVVKTLSKNNYTIRCSGTR